MSVSIKIDNLNYYIFYRKEHIYAFLLNRTN